MFCKNCGQQYVTDEAVMCVKCGFQKGMGNRFCPQCGQPTPPNSTVCMNCGVALNEYGMVSDKSKVTAGILGLLLGAFGVHNFYLGYTTKAVIQVVVTSVSLLLTCCTFGISGFVAVGIEIWGIVEGIMILCGSISTDAQGRKLKD